MTSTTRYLDPGVDKTLFQCIFQVVRSGAGVETGLSKVSLLCLFILGLNVVDSAEICDLGILGDSMPVYAKQVLVPCLYPIPWKIRPISFDIRLLHLSFSGPMMRCRYYWDFPVMGQMTALV